MTTEVSNGGAGMAPATMMRSAGAGTRPGADWAGWLGYAPTARGPEARRARAEAAGLIEPLVLAPETATVVVAASPSETAMRSRSPRRRALAPTLRRRRPCAASDGELFGAAGLR